MPNGKRTERLTKKRVPIASDGAARKAAGLAGGHVHHAAVDEDRERAGEDPRAFSIETPDGDDELGEELGEAFIENATGADDAAMAQSDVNTPEDEGGPFVITTGASEFAHGTDPSNPADADREAFPTVSKRRPEGSAPPRR